MSVRKRLQQTRNSVTHKFCIGGHECYMTVGMYGDGSPGELFIKMAKEGSTMAGLMDVIGILVSMSLQHGVPLETIAAKMINTRFEPYDDKATSIMDYIFKWMMNRYKKGETK